MIILLFWKRFAASSGIGTLVALMLPYALAFGVAWSAMLVLWIGSGMELGPQGPLFYSGPALLPVVP